MGAVLGRTVTAWTSQSSPRPSTGEVGRGCPVPTRAGEFGAALGVRATSRPRENSSPKNLGEPPQLCLSARPGAADGWRGHPARCQADSEQLGRVRPEEAGSGSERLCTGKGMPARSHVSSLSPASGARGCFLDVSFRCR